MTVPETVPLILGLEEEEEGGEDVEVFEVVELLEVLVVLVSVVAAAIVILEVLPGAVGADVLPGKRLWKNSIIPAILDTSAA